MNGGPALCFFKWTGIELFIVTFAVLLGLFAKRIYRKQLSGLRSRFFPYRSLNRREKTYAYWDSFLTGVLGCMFFSALAVLWLYMYVGEAYHQGGFPIDWHVYKYGY